MGDRTNGYPDDGRARGVGRHSGRLPPASRRRPEGAHLQRGGRAGSGSGSCFACGSFGPGRRRHRHDLGALRKRGIRPGRRSVQHTARPVGALGSTRAASRDGVIARRATAWLLAGRYNGRSGNARHDLRGSCRVARRRSGSRHADACRFRHRARNRTPPARHECARQQRLDARGVVARGAAAERHGRLALWPFRSSTIASVGPAPGGSKIFSTRFQCGCLLCFCRRCF